MQADAVPEGRTGPGIIPRGLFTLTTAARRCNLSQIPGLPQQPPQPLLPWLPCQPMPHCARPLSGTSLPPSIEQGTNSATFQINPVTVTRRGESFHALMLMYPKREELDFDSLQSQEMEVSFTLSLVMVKDQQAKISTGARCHQTCPSLQDLEVCLVCVHMGGGDAEHRG